MEEVKKMSVQDKIKLIEYIKKSYNSISMYWTTDKVKYLEKLIRDDLIRLSDF